MTRGTNDDISKHPFADYDWPAKGGQAWQRPLQLYFAKMEWRLGCPHLVIFRVNIPAMSGILNWVIPDRH